MASGPLNDRPYAIRNFHHPFATFAINSGGIWDNTQGTSSGLQRSLENMSGNSFELRCPRIIRAADCDA
jgi:hypothetical protein